MNNASNIKLAKANKKDFSEIAKIYSEEFSKPPYNEPWHKKKSLKKLKIFIKYCDIWKIIYEKKIVGFLVINPNHWFPGEIIFIEEIAIKEKFQRLGIGTFSLNRIFQIYKKKGYKKYMGLINCSSKSLGLHKKIGAKENKWDLLMEKEL